MIDIYVHVLKELSNVAPGELDEIKDELETLSDKLGKLSYKRNQKKLAIDKKVASFNDEYSKIVGSPCYRNIECYLDGDLQFCREVGVEQAIEDSDLIKKRRVLFVNHHLKETKGDRDKRIEEGKAIFKSITIQDVLTVGIENLYARYLFDKSYKGKGPK